MDWDPIPSPWEDPDFETEFEKAWKALTKWMLGKESAKGLQIGETVRINVVGPHRFPSWEKFASGHLRFWIFAVVGEQGLEERKFEILEFNHHEGSPFTDAGTNILLRRIK